MGDLRVVGDPRAAERHCEEDEDDSDMVSFSVLGPNRGSLVERSSRSEPG